MENEEIKMKLDCKEIFKISFMIIILLASVGIGLGLLAFFLNLIATI